MVSSVRESFRYGLKDVLAENSQFLEVKSVKIQITCSRMSLTVPLEVQFAPIEKEMREAVLLLPTSLRSVLYSLTVDITTPTGDQNTVKQKLLIDVFKIGDAEEKFKGNQQKANLSSGIARLLHERQDCILLRIGCIPARSEVQATLQFCIKPSDPVALNTYHFSIKSAYECFIGRDTDVETSASSHLQDALSSINQMLASRTKITCFQMYATSSCGAKGLKAASSTHRIEQDGLSEQIDGGRTTVVKYSVNEPIIKTSDGRFEVNYTFPELSDSKGHSKGHSNCIVVNEERNKKFKKRTLHSVLLKHRMPVDPAHPVG